MIGKTKSFENRVDILVVDKGLIGGKFALKGIKHNNVSLISLFILNLLLYSTIT